MIDGIGPIEGPIVGTVLFFLLRELLADYGAWYLIVIGLVAVVTMIACPSGHPPMSFRARGGIRSRGH